MKTTKNRLFGELNESMISKKSMAITKGGTDKSDAGGSPTTTSDTGFRTTTSDQDFDLG